MKCCCKFGSRTDNISKVLMAFYTKNSKNKIPEFALALLYTITKNIPKIRGLELLLLNETGILFVKISM